MLLRKNTMHWIHRISMTELHHHLPLKGAHMTFGNIIRMTWRIDKISRLVMTKQNGRRSMLRLPDLMDATLLPSIISRPSCSCR